MYGYDLRESLNNLGCTLAMMTITLPDLSAQAVNEGSILLCHSLALSLWRSVFQHLWTSISWSTFHGKVSSSWYIWRDESKVLV